VVGLTRRAKGAAAARLRAGELEVVFRHAGLPAPDWDPEAEPLPDEVSAAGARPPQTVGDSGGDLHRARKQQPPADRA
jgi:hypothetical protein